MKIKEMKKGGILIAAEEIVLIQMNIVEEDEEAMAPVVVPEVTLCPIFNW